MRAPALAAAGLTLALASAGCGSSGPALRVSAASSLTRAFAAYAGTLRGTRVAYDFAGSDALAAQIRGGVRPDVFAAADAALPHELFERGLLERPVAFATNRLVVAVPRRGGGVRSLEDLARPGVTIALGSPSVPVGSYARRALGRLARAQARAILAHVRSAEPDVAGIVAKLIQGAVDAGFVYATDVRAAGRRLRAIALPARIAPRVVYEAGVVRGAPHPDGARRFLRGLLSRAGRRVLRRAGFGPPPR